MKRKQEKRSEQGFRAYEVLEKNSYRYSIFPSDGDPFKVIAEEQERNHNLYMVEVRNGERTVAVPPRQVTREADEFDFEYDEEEYQ